MARNRGRPRASRIVVGVQTLRTGPHSILMLLFGDLGDTLLTVPAIRAVRRRYRLSTVVIMAKEQPGRYVLELGLADELIDIDKHSFDRLRSLVNPRAVADVLGLVRRLRRSRVDMLLVFQHLTTRWGVAKYASVAVLSGAAVRAGLDNGRGWFLTHRARDRGFGAAHEAEYWLDVAALVGASGDLHLEAVTTDRDRREALRLLAGVGIESGPILAIHPGVGWYGPGRQWGPERFAEAARIVLNRVPMRCILVGTEIDRAAAEVVERGLGTDVETFVGKTSTGVLAAVLERCELLISNDGGVAHLAAAVKTPTLTVFGPSNDAAWRPLGGSIVTADVPCRPCLYRDFEIGLRAGCATRECLALITPRSVAERAVALLASDRIHV